MINWTAQQELAINRIESNILVSAAAGSGKTAVLTERIVELMEKEKIDINRFLVFTFSRAAANEMKERVYKKILEGLNKSDYAEFYTQQLIKITQAKITTIHGFCNDVVRSHFFMLGIDPDYRIRESKEFSLIKSGLLDDIFEEHYQRENKEFEALVETYASQRSDIKLKDIVLEIHKKLQSHTDYNLWLDDVLDQYSNQEIWLKRLHDYILEEFDLAIVYVKIIIKIIETETDSSKYLTFFLEEMEMLKKAYDINRENLFDLSINFERLPSDKKIDEIPKKRIKEIRDYYKKKLKLIQKGYYIDRNIHKHIEEFEFQKETIECLINIVKEFDSRLLDYKKEKNVLEFSDLEHFALEVLNNDEIAKSYQDTFDFVFVDEYQDSNYIQEAIIQKIKRKNNLFMVGDLKQSIYKFRLAEPEIFSNKYRTFSRDKSDLDYKLDLNKNFRSRGNILNFINYIFTDFMTDDFGGMIYDKQSMLYQGNDDFKGEDPSVEINLVRIHSGEFTKEEIEAREIADKIISLNRDEGVKYRDIVILMRSPSTYVKNITKIFGLVGIPLFADVSEKFIDTMEVQLMLNYLRVIDNQRQDIPLVSLMRSPIYKFLDDELYKIREKCQSEYFHECIMEYSENDEIKTKIKFLLNNLKMFREKSRFLSIDNLIWDIYVKDGINIFLTGLPLGDLRNANVILLMDIANEYELKGITSLKGFISYIDSMNEKNRDFDNAKIINEKSNVVRLMSVHKSKGLEFPVVIFAGTGKRFNQVDSRGDIVVHSKLGIISKYFDVPNRIKRNTFHKDLVAYLINRENSEEEMRILYVALTRAKERLILFAGINDKQYDDNLIRWKEQINLGGIERNTRFIDWIMFNLEKKKSVTMPKFTINTIENKYVHFLNIISKLSKYEYIDLINSRIDDNINQIELNDFEPLVWEQSKSKISVTDIAHKNFELVSKVETNRFSKNSLSKKESSAELGTQVHKIMQIIKLNQLNTYEEFKEQIEWMKKNSFIDIDIEDRFDLNLIYNFFKSELGLRLLSSNQIYREAPFILKKAVNNIQGFKGNDNILIQGVIDCYFVDEGEVVVIDFKSDEVTEMTYSHSIPKYTVQLDYYAQAIEQLTGHKVKERYIHFLRKNESYKINSSII